MHKKLMLVCMAIAAFAAFVVAPSALASPELTESGTTLAVGSSVKAINTGPVTFAIPSTTFTCSNAELKGTVIKSSGTEFEYTSREDKIDISGTNILTDCTGGYLGAVKPRVFGWLCIRGIPKTDEIIIDGCMENGVTQILTLTLSLTGNGTECKYDANKVQTKYTTGADAVISVAEHSAQRVEGSIVFCPTEIKLDVDLELETTVGTTLLIS